MNGAELETTALTITERALAFPEIKTPQDYDIAGNLTLALNDARKEITAFFKPQKYNLDQAKKVVLEKEKEMLAPLNKALDRLEPMVASYLREQRRLREEAQEKARQEALRRSEEEILARAAKAEAGGNHEAARAILEEPVVLKAVERVAEIPKVRGITTMEVWKARVTDFPALVKAVAAGDAPMECLLPSDLFLGKEAKATKGASPYPGVQFYSEDSVRKG